MDEKTTNPNPNPGTQEHEYGCFFCKTAKPAFQRFWTEATVNHFRNSRLEFLKGMRSLIDDRISHLSNMGAKGTRVTVE